MTLQLLTVVHGGLLDPSPAGPSQVRCECRAPPEDLAPQGRLEEGRLIPPSCLLKSRGQRSQTAMPRGTQPGTTPQGLNSKLEL